MPNHTINVPIASRESLLLPEGATPVSHAGVWYCDPKLYPNIEVGDSVTFRSNGELLAYGYVTEIIDPSDASRKYCSGVNTFGFKWRVKEQDA